MFGKKKRELKVKQKEALKQEQERAYESKCEELRDSVQGKTLLAEVRKYTNVPVELWFSNKGDLGEVEIQGVAFEASFYGGLHVPITYPMLDKINLQEVAECSLLRVGNYEFFNDVEENRSTMNDIVEQLLEITDPEEVFSVHNYCSLVGRNNYVKIPYASFTVNGNGIEHLYGNQYFGWILKRYIGVKKL